jgi:plasmid stabilization system protein ParE
MSVRKTEEFLLDVERQFEWYVRNATRNVAQRYLDAVEATTLLLGRHPRLGPRGGFKQPRLRSSSCFVPSTSTSSSTSLPAATW